MRQPLSTTTRVVAGTVAALAAAALANRYLARKAERDNPPEGRFITVNGVRLHYIEKGEGPPLVLLHGNGAMIQDMTSSGLVDLAARHFRVLVFDRPGFGHSSRPRAGLWTPAAQADLIAQALDDLDVPRAAVLGHSWGASVALQLGLRHPERVSSLILASGYYFATPRPDVALLGAPALPGLGDIMVNTLSPLIGRMIWPALLKVIFSPARIPAKFSGFPKSMALRPSQLRASAAEVAFMIPSAFFSSKDYGAVEMPVTILCGAQDRFISPRQSKRLHRTIAHSRLQLVAGAGHMVHQTNPSAVVAAIIMTERSANPNQITGEDEQAEPVPASSLAE